MQGTPSRSDRLALGLAGWVTRHAWLVVGLTVLVVAAAGGGVRYLEFSNNYRTFFSPENPELIAFEKFQATYTKNDNILFVVQPRHGDVFTPRVADAVERLTAEAWKIPYAIRVDSVTNFQHSSADGDDLTVQDLVRGASTMSESELEEKREVALDEPLLRGSLVSPDAGTTGINVTLQYPEQSLGEVPEAVAFARGLAAKIEADYEDVHVAMTGVSMLNNAFAEVGQRDAMTLMPLMFGVLVVFIVVVLRSFGGAAATLAVIGMSAATALGLAGWAGMRLDPISVMAPTIILTLAIADSVHLLLTTLALMRQGRDRLSALRESLRVNFVAVWITSITTIVGFLSLNFSDAPPFRNLGNITAIGITAALIYSITFLPAAIRLIPLRVRPGAPAGGRDDAVMARFADWVTSHHRSVLFGSAVVSVLLLAAVPRIDLNDEWVKYFDSRVPFRVDAEFAMDNLTGIYLVEYSMDSGKAGGINDPSYLEALDRFTGWLRSQPEIRHVYSYADVIKRLNRNMHGDEPAWYRLPADRDLAAQYLLLYELSLPYGLDLNDRISVDKSSTRITASVGEISTVAVRDLIDRAERWLRQNVGTGVTGGATGATVMFSHISQRNIDSMLTGNVLALLLIAAILMIALRSVSFGGLSLIPNALPVLATFGVWALSVGQVGMAAATVTATSLGIVVDDTVHFMTKYVRARREQGLDRPQAIRYAFMTVGRAIVGTTVILAFGFGVLALSTFRVNEQMGLLTALTILIALPMDLLLLPSLLMIGHKARVKKEERNHEQVLAPAS